MPTDYPVPKDEGMEGIVPQEKEPLNGPAEAKVDGKPEGFAGKSGYGFDGTDAFKVNAPHPVQPMNAADFPKNATFSRGTKDNDNTGGLA